MATLHVALCYVQTDQAVPKSKVLSAATLTPGGASALSGLTGSPGQFWSVTASGGDAYIKMGAGTPVAATNDGWYIASGQTREFAVTDASEKLAHKSV